MRDGTLREQVKLPYSRTLLYKFEICVWRDVSKLCRLTPCPEFEVAYHHSSVSNCDRPESLSEGTRPGQVEQHMGPSQQTKWQNIRFFRQTLLSQDVMGVQPYIRSSIERPIGGGCHAWRMQHPCQHNPSYILPRPLLSPPLFLAFMLWWKIKH